MLSMMTMVAAIFAVLLFAIVYVATVGKIGVRKGREPAVIFRRQMIGLFIAYILALLVVTILGREKRDDDLIFFVPFSDLYTIIKNAYPWYTENYILLDLLNIALFIPHGILACEVMRGKKLWPILSGFGVSLLIELIQLITKLGVFDVNDLLWNTVGTLIGCGLYVLVAKLANRKKKK